MEVLGLLTGFAYLPYKLLVKPKYEGRGRWIVRANGGIGITATQSWP